MVAAILGALAALLGALLIQRSKTKSAEALLENQESLQQIAKIQAEKEKNNANLQLEEQRREDVKKQSKEKIDDTPTVDELLEFLNRPKSGD